MKESELAFWQKTARHYTRSMDRSAPLYAAVCERIRPHLSRDMNVLELACGTGQLSFPLSPYVRLWEATDAAPAMIQEAKKADRLLTPPLLCPGCRPSALRAGVLRRGGHRQCPAHPAGAGSRAPGDPAGSEAGRMVVCPYLCPRRRAAGKASHLVYGANRFPCLPPLERWGVCLLFVHERFLGGGTRAAGRQCAPPLLRRLPVDTGGISRWAEYGGRPGTAGVRLAD